MIGDGIQEEVLRALVEQHAVRECLAAKIDDGPGWSPSIHLGGSGARWVPVRSRRKRLRTWGSLTAVGCFAKTSVFKVSPWSYERFVAVWIGPSVTWRQSGHREPLS